MSSRRSTLAALFGGVALLAALILADVLATVFLAITVAYVLVPLYRWLLRRGLHRWWASAVATTTAFLGVIAVFVPIAAILYVRRRSIIAALESLPATVTLDVAGFAYTVNASDVTDIAARSLSRLAVTVARETPVIAAKAIVFGFVVFALLMRGEEVRRALLAPIPDRYHDVAFALHGRIRGTLYALYVIQAATAFATFLIALPVFVFLDYPNPIALSVVAGVLQFLPVVGPSLLVFALAAYQIAVGSYAAAVAVAVLGFLFVAFLPDPLIRPRLARETAHLPGSLYFVGFTGGLLTLGPVGIIAGPLVVALLVETLSLLADEMHPEG